MYHKDCVPPDYTSYPHAVWTEPAVTVCPLIKMCYVWAVVHLFDYAVQTNIGPSSQQNSGLFIPTRQPLLIILILCLGPNM